MNVFKIRLGAIEKYPPIIPTDLQPRESHLLPLIIFPKQSYLAETKE